MQTTLSGTLYVYQGEELGQRNMPPSFEPSEYKDIETINYWEKVPHNLPKDTTREQPTNTPRPTDESRLPRR
jgi:oligo-1,6-glucosidase